MVSIKIAERTLQLLLLQELLLVTGSHQKLSEIYPTRTVRVDYLKDALHLVRLKSGITVTKDRYQLIPLYDSIAIDIDLFEGLQQNFLILVRIELRCNVGINYRLQLVLELSESEIT
jgi:hypothetical protein